MTVSIVSLKNWSAISIDPFIRALSIASSPSIASYCSNVKSSINKPSTSAPPPSPQALYCRAVHCAFAEPSIASHPIHCRARAVHRAIAEPSRRARAPMPSRSSPSRPTPSRLALHRQAFEHSIVAPSLSCPSQAILFIAEHEPSIAPSLSRPSRAICFIAECEI